MFGEKVKEMSETAYRGRSKATIKLLKACQKIIDATAPITVRGICYRLFVAMLIESMEKKNTQKISRLLVWAREEGVVPWAAIVDESRKLERAPHWKDLSGYAEAIEESYRRDFWAHQEHQVIVISEKATVSGLLRPVLREYGVPFFAVHGFDSASHVRRLAQEIRADDRQTVLLYCGDYDPSGLFMSAVDLPCRLAEYGAGDQEDGDYVVRRIALTYADVKNGNLPSFPASDKKKDPRYKWFISNYGDNAWELDALDPNTLRDRVKESIGSYIDPGDWQRHLEIEQLQRETTKRIAAAMIEAGANCF
jgi:hypothetical protein